MNTKERIESELEVKSYIQNLNGINYEEIDMGDGSAYRFRKSEDVQYEELSGDEKNILDLVIKKFGKMNKDEIVTYMHSEQAYVNTPRKGIISYAYAESLSL